VKELIDQSRDLTHHHLRQEPLFMLHVQQELGTPGAAQSERDNQESSGAGR